MARKKRKKQKNKSKLALFLISSGILLLIFAITIKAHNALILSFTGNYANTVTKPGKTTPVRVIIPKIDVSQMVYKTKIVNGTWQVSQNGASYLENSSGVGEKYSMIIYNHNTLGKFDKLHELKPQDTIVIEGSDKKIHIYKVKEIKIVDPTDIKVLTEDSSENLILYTCYGFADLKRFVVKAVPTS